jgi:hypothetical protein
MPQIGTEQFRSSSVYTDGLPRMSVETKEATREKITQPRRLLQQTIDPSTAKASGSALKNWSIGYRSKWAKARPNKLRDDSLRPAVRQPTSYRVH